MPGDRLTSDEKAACDARHKMDSYFGLYSDKTISQPISKSGILLGQSAYKG
jgi:hypothetical protein